jgi:beta-phosphoglucomutase
MGLVMSVYIRAVIFDLDGVITDTAEYHFLAWKKLADEEGLPFTRADNEALRGVSRRDSLNLLLDGLLVSEEQAGEMMARKNSYYREMLSSITPADLLPGTTNLLAEIRSAGIKIAIASASRNAPDVVARLGIEDQLDILAHGGSVTRQKPAPDLFLFTARQLGVPPAECLVVEDAQAGIAAAHAAGMLAAGLGPVERVGSAEIVLPNLEGVRLSDLLRAATWRVCETSFVKEKQNHRETLFTHGNGYLSTRGSFEERFPGDSQATLVHGLWDDVPISFTELANAPDWTALEIRVNGHRFDMQPGYSQDYARYLDLRTGILHRRLIWSPDPDCPVEIAFERFASLADEHLLALRVRITPLAGSADVSVRALLDSHVENQGVLHWEQLSQECGPGFAHLEVQTRHTGKILAMSTRVSAQHASTRSEGLDCPGCPGVALQAQVDRGETFSVEKLTAIFSSRDTESPLSAAQIRAEQASQEGYENLSLLHCSAWDDFWDSSDVIIEGDDEAQLAVRHALFQLRIAAPTRDEHSSIGAKTLSGFGYRGHVFWDNEIFVLPFFTCTQPQIARNMLMYRYHGLPGARRKATGNGFAGAQFPWESAETGDEVTPTWVPHFADPTRLVRIWTGDIQIHISADIAYAMHQYWQVTGEEDFWREVGVPVVLETAVFWGERVEPEGDRFAIRDVIGPDENHDHVDNNQFTNYMVRWHLQTALEALRWLKAHAPDILESLVAELDLTPKRLAHWQRVIDGLILLHDRQSGLIEQFEGFFELKDVDWPAFMGRTQSMQEILGIEGCTEYKALKQADVIALLCLLGDQFDEKTWKANWEYYVPMTDHEYGSSLGPSMHAWAACRMNKPDEAYHHFMRAARADLLDVRGNAGDGIHAASAGGLWEVCVFGFAGMRRSEAGLTFDPKLPSHWKRLAFTINYRGEQKRVDFRQVDLEGEAG